MHHRLHLWQTVSRRGTLFLMSCRGRHNTTPRVTHYTYLVQATLLYFGGLGSLQKRSNNLNTTTAGYSETFQSSLQVRSAVCQMRGLFHGARQIASEHSHAAGVDCLFIGTLHLLSVVQTAM